MTRRTYKSGETQGQFTQLLRATMETPAWRALSPNAQALYPWLKLEWKGADYDNNGNIQLSVRQAAYRLGVAPNTATKAFHDLQAKGFIKVNKIAHLGVGGNAKGHTYFLMELRHKVFEGKIEGRSNQTFRDWRKGNDFPVIKAQTNNPKGKNGKTESQPNFDEEPS